MKHELAMLGAQFANKLDRSIRGQHLDWKVGFINGREPG
jgi:hypothetical protein